MGKHNGRARNLGGPKVGLALARRAKPPSARGSGADRHTTDEGAPNMQSVLERNDLDELMAMADLADRDFTAERGAAVVVISTGAVDPLAAERDARERKEAEARHAHKLRVPRRPHWDADTTAEQLDAQEKAAFLDWRRELAHLEEEEKLVLTPFERNLEVWRQLWRVLERSDIIVQVVDARDPLTYVSEDLAGYARSIHPSKRTLILLNKSDLLPQPVRQVWADHFEVAGVDCVFWSAFAATEAQAKAKASAAAGVEEGPGVGPAGRWQGGQWVQGQQDDEEEDERTRVLGVEELLDVLEERARAAVGSAGADDPRRHDPDRRFMVGLVGYPNVGKSSTINAIFGSKKTAVAPTPGKTKHFQTLNVSDTICLCDCPGLVLPKFANSKAEMVAAGVIPIDRLTDVRAPVDIVAARAGRSQLEAVYGLRLPGPKPLQAPTVHNAPPAAAQLLAALAGARGWVGGSGLPDEARAGRQILKDYVAGKLLYCQLPPGHSLASFAPSIAPTPEALAAIKELPTATQQQHQQHQQHQQPSQPAEQAGPSDDPEDDAGTSDEQPSPSEDGGDTAAVASGVATTSQHGRAAAAPTGAAGAGEPSSSNGGGELELDDADLELLDGLQGGGKQKARRPDYKFNKKSARSKGTRGLQRDAGGYDGAALVIGKKGGLVRVGS